MNQLEAICTFRALTYRAIRCTSFNFMKPAIAVMTCDPSLIHRAGYGNASHYINYTLDWSDCKIDVFIRYGFKYVDYEYEDAYRAGSLSGINAKLEKSMSPEPVKPMINRKQL